MTWSAKMGRAIFLLVLGFGAYVFYAHELWDFVRPQDQLIWAALLPLTYVLGMALLKD